MRRDFTLPVTTTALGWSGIRRKQYRARGPPIVSAGGFCRRDVRHCRSLSSARRPQDPSARFYRTSLPAHPAGHGASRQLAPYAGHSSLLRSARHPCSSDLPADTPGDRPRPVCCPVAGRPTDRAALPITSLSVTVGGGARPRDLIRILSLQ